MVSNQVNGRIANVWLPESEVECGAGMECRLARLLAARCCMAIVLACTDAPGLVQGGARAPPFYFCLVLDKVLRRAEPWTTLPSRSPSVRLVSRLNSGVNLLGRGENSTMICPAQYEICPSRSSSPRFSLHWTRSTHRPPGSSV